MKSLIPSFTRLLGSLSLFATAPLLSSPAEDLVELTKDHTQFAFSLYPALENPETNLVFSPSSIASCLSMVYIGARGETASQMEKTLQLNIDRKVVAKTTAALNQSLLLKKKEENGYQLKLANALWVDQGTFLLADYRYAIEEQFHAKLGMLNFAQNPHAYSIINQWIAEQTQDKIPHLLTQDDLNPLTRLVLTNAVYFQGSWAHPFDPKMTQAAPFNPTPDTTIEVKMMPQLLSTPYFENELLQAIALPFIGTSNSGSQLGLVIFMPKSADNFLNVVQELETSYDDWISSLNAQLVDLKIPKFNLLNRFELNKPLEQLGMEDAFSSEANFTGIDGMRDLSINKVIHQAFFDLDENGVTAAAATTASIGLKSTPPELAISMHIDHPFLFFIVDLNSHEMLFMGKVVEPGNVK